MQVINVRRIGSICLLKGDESNNLFTLKATMNSIESSSLFPYTCIKNRNYARIDLKLERTFLSNVM